jgi:uncharacterized protein
MNITLTGGTGFVGRRLVHRLLAEKHTVKLLGRNRKTGFGSSVENIIWDATEAEPPAESLRDADAIIHLAGEPVAQRWTREAKRRIRASRVEGTRRLIQALSTLSTRPSVMVSASAVGIYGSRGSEVLTEASRPGEGWLADLNKEWEATADLAKALGIRLVKLRIGIVLGKEGGVLARMAPPFRWGLGGRMGPGTQYMPWIHLNDLVGLILYCLTTEKLQGPVNATAPNPATNAEFAEELGAALRRPTIFPLPTFMIKAIFGEMSEVILSSQRAVPKAAEGAGYVFQFPALCPALRDALA